jgi:hypothetical protein
VNLEPLRRLKSKLSVAFLAAAALILASCGGGGATATPGGTGLLQLLPGSATIYAGVPYTANIVGGRKPYLVTSNEPTLIELNFTTDSNTFTFVARNPGVVDVGLEPDEVPRRSVIIEVRDSNGISISNTYNVLQNFFTGYGESYTAACAASGAGETPQACSGSDTLITLIPVSNGTLYGNRELQFDKVRGDYQFLVENPATTPQLVDQLRVRTDHLGRAFVRVRVSAGAPTQFATYKITDVATGASTNAVFVIVQQPVVDAISVFPTTLSFSGSLAGRCGAGSADIFVFGGTPPYNVTGSSGVAVSPSTISASGGRTAVTLLLTSTPCSPGSVVVSDSRGSVATVTVENNEGSGTLPPLSLAPTTIASLACGTTTTITVVGGVGQISAASQHPRITATASSGTISITRLNGDGATIYPTSGTVTVTDGATIETIDITATPANCP